MYAPYFGLSREPFSIAPDPRYLFMSERHREALAHLVYGLGGGGGFVLLTGEIGTGKTTVCRCFLEQVPQDCNVAYIFNPKLNAVELLQSVCSEFGIVVPRRVDGPPTAMDHLEPLNAFLLQAHAQGRNNVLVIDEAQNLSADVLEQLRLLTNLETSERKLLQIVLIGQPELRTLLARPQLEQLAQRVVARYHLDALTREETTQYVRHRLEVAGLERPLPFDRAALERVHRLTGGVPRRINLLCDRALLGAYGRSEPVVTRAIVEQAAREVFAPAVQRRKRSRTRPEFVLALGLAAGVGLAVGVQHFSGAPVTQASGTAAPTATLAAAPAAPASGPVAAASGAQATTAAAGPVTEAAAAAPAAPAASAAAAPAAAATAAAAAASAPAAAAADPVPPVAPTLFTDERQAWRALAEVWQADPGTGNPCTRLPRAELHCFSRSVPLALIRQLDRPGIVVLDRDTGRPSYALLTALSDKAATLTAGGRSQTVSLPALAARWSGEWSTLWKQPPGFDAGIDSRPVARWVETHLAGDGADGAARPPLATRLRAFQLAQGLPADGVLGPMTFMQLNRQAGVSEPRLQPVP
jgi:general secretion pathway protein A